MGETEPVLPKYLQIAEQIRGRIMRGELAPGAGVPSEREIAAEWHVARPTVTKALDVLRQQGLIQSRKGAGTFVREQTTRLRMREHYGRASAVDDADAEMAEFLRVGLVAVPSAQVATAFGQAEGSQVIERRALISSEETGPVSLVTSWFPEKLVEAAPELLRRERIRGGEARYLEAATGIRIAMARDRMSARLADPDERRHLVLPRPSAVLVHRLTVHTADDAVIQFDERVYPPGRWQFRQDHQL